jgi:regulatory protein
MTRRRSPEAAAKRREERAQLTDQQPVMDAAAAFLSVRPRSVAETRRRLLRSGYPENLVGQVIDRLASLRYLDDVEFARLWVESRDRARPRGEIALRRELALKGVARETVDAVLGARATAGTAPDHAAAEALLERRRGALERERDPQRRRQKAFALLARNGFDPETCRTAASAFAADVQAFTANTQPDHSDGP